LERTFVWLESGIDIGVFYAALDLRFVLEKTVLKHALASQNYSKKFNKKNWQLFELYKDLKEEFAPRIDLTKAYEFYFGGTDTAQQVGSYLPMSDALFADYGRLSDLLHAQWAIPFHTPDRKWLSEKQAFVSGLATKLISHANPKNSLNFLSVPGARFVEIDWSVLEATLKSYWGIGESHA